MKAKALRAPCDAIRRQPCNPACLRVSAPRRGGTSKPAGSCRGSPALLARLVTSRENNSCTLAMIVSIGVAGSLRSQPLQREYVSSRFCLITLIIPPLAIAGLVAAYPPAAHKIALPFEKKTRTPEKRYEYLPQTMSCCQGNHTCSGPCRRPRKRVAAISLLRVVSRA